MSSDKGCFATTQSADFLPQFHTKSFVRVRIKDLQSDGSLVGFILYLKGHSPKKETLFLGNFQKGGIVLQIKILAQSVI